LIKVQDSGQMLKNPAQFLSLCLLLPALLFAETGSRWISLSAGLEASAYQDEVSGDFHGASSESQALYASAGRNDWLLAGYAGAQKINQRYWSWQGHRIAFWGRAPLPLGFRFSLAGYRVKGDASPQSRGLGILLDHAIYTGLPHSTRFMAGLSRAQVPLLEDTLLVRRDASGHEFRLVHATHSASYRLSWLSTSRNGEVEQALLLRARLGAGRYRAHASFLRGKIHFWHDEERLVIHDSREALKSIVAGGIELDLNPCMTMSLSLGRELLDGHSATWFYLGLAWSRRTWMIR
jgi:hypothetical protein